MRRTVSWCLTIGGLVLIWGAVVAACGQTPPSPGIQVGEPAPDFAVKALSGDTFKLSNYRGRPVVIHFFASWLGGSCWQEMYRLDDAAARYRDQRLVVIGIAARDPAADVDHMAKRLGLTFPIGLDPNSHVAVDQYRIRLIPTTVFLDRDGVVREIWTGPIDWSSLLGLIAEIL